MFKSNLIKYLIFIILLIFAISCSNKESGSNPIPLAAPTTPTFVGKHEAIEISFTRIYPGDSSSSVLPDPSYEVRISTENNLNNAILLGEVRAENLTTGLAQAFIYKAIPESEEGNSFRNLEYVEITDSKTYYIFIRAKYEGYGYSSYVMVSGRTEPLPEPVKNAKVIIGDKHLFVSWDELSDMEYAVNVNDCPKNQNGMDQLDFWTPANKLNKPNFIINLANNTEKKTICIASRNNNGSGAWVIFDSAGNPTHTFTASQKEWQGEAATSAPTKPSYLSTSVARSSVSIIFNPAHDGKASLGDYQICADSDTNCDDVLLTDNETRAVKSGLVTGRAYQIYLKATNSFGSTSGDKVTLTPAPAEIDWNNADAYLGTAVGTFIFAESVPHSDLARVGQWNNARGGRSSDRLPYAKETALGNLFADALKWYGDTYYKGGKIDFAILRARAFNAGIENGQNITMRFLSGITNADFLDDTIIVLKVPGNKLVSETNKVINLENYPDLQSEAIVGSLFGQMAAAYHVAHYGIGATNNGAYFGVPSKEARLEIDYLAYNFKENITNNENFKSGGKCAKYLDRSNTLMYDYKLDPDGCYKFNPYQDNADKDIKVGLTRGKIKSAKIGGVEVDPNREYTIITTKGMISAYPSLASSSQDSAGIANITLIRAVGEYIADSGIITPLLDGRVHQFGGLPTNDANNFYKRSDEE